MPVGRWRRAPVGPARRDDLLGLVLSGCSERGNHKVWDCGVSPPYLQAGGSGRASRPTTTSSESSAVDAQFRRHAVSELDCSSRLAILFWKSPLLLRMERGQSWKTCTRPTRTPSAIVANATSGSLEARKSKSMRRKSMGTSLLCSVFNGGEVRVLPVWRRCLASVLRYCWERAWSNFLEGH